MAEKSSAKERIESLKEQMLKETDALKVELANELKEACDTYRTLLELGIKDIFKDPQFAEYVKILNINNGSIGTETMTAKGRAPKNSLRTHILEILSNGHKMSHSQIKDALSKRMGGGYNNNQYNLLAKMVDEKVISQDGDGRDALYFAKK